MSLDHLINVISPPRLSYYELFLNYKKPEDKIGAYLAFQELSSNFFPVIQMIEVGLRNSINNVAKTHFQDEYWFLTMPISTKSQRQVKEAERKAKNECGSDYTSDDIICRLTLGFWVYMLDRDYRDTSSPSHLWSPENRDRVFKKPANALGKSLSLRSLFDNYHKVLKLRNRLFHHEPIWKKHKCRDVQTAVQNVKKDYDFLIEMLNCISPVKTSILKCIDIPNKLHNNCTVEYINKIITEVKKEITVNSPVKHF